MPGTQDNLVNELHQAQVSVMEVLGAHVPSLGLSTPQAREDGQLECNLHFCPVGTQGLDHMTTDQHVRGYLQSSGYNGMAKKANKVTTEEATSELRYWQWEQRWF